MPNELFGSCSGCAEPERSGTKPAHRRLHVVPPRDLRAEALGPRQGVQYHVSFRFTLFGSHLGLRAVTCALGQHRVEPMHPSLAPLTNAVKA